MTQAVIVCGGHKVRVGDEVRVVAGRHRDSVGTVRRIMIIAKRPEHPLALWVKLPELPVLLFWPEQLEKI